MIGFWGQEPTLTLNLITDHLEEWLSYLPNVNKFAFSTNGIAYGDRIIDFIIGLETFLNHPCTLDLQFSYDGAESTSDLRKAKNEQILNTIQFVLNKLNNISLKKVNININIHGVLSLELINRLNTVEKIKNYYLDLDKTMEKITSWSNNKKVHIGPAISLGDECPTQASTEDGLNFYNFYLKSRSLDLNDFSSPSIINTINCIPNIVNAAWVPTVEQLIHSRNLDDFLDFINLNYKDEKINKILCNSLFCCNNYSELKIMYDGTLCNCQNHIFETQLENLPNIKDFKNQVKRNLVKHNYFINPLKDSDEIIEKNLSMFTAAKETSFYYTYQQTVSLMYYLSQTNQIHKSYKEDFRKLQIHAIPMSLLHQCSYNNQMMTGSMFNKYTGIIRFFCNGIIDEAIELAEKEK